MLEVGCWSGAILEFMLVQDVGWCWGWCGSGGGVRAGVAVGEGVEVRVGVENWGWCWSCEQVLKLRLMLEGLVMKASGWCWRWRRCWTC